MNLELKNKTAFVCGSTQGIGKATAIQLAQQGANIVLIARNETALITIKNSLPTSENQKHDYIAVDFSNPANVSAKISAYIKKHPYANILVNNTGGPAGGLAIDANTDEFIHAFNMHLINNQILAKHLVPLMKENGYGRIINIISTSVKQPLNGLGVSNTIRGAVANWSKTLANELGQYNITVNNVLPGATNTIRLKTIIENKASKSGQSIDEVSQTMTSQVPMLRFAEAEEIANGVAFLASPAASYINGVNLPIDGGRTKSL
ncbi:MAG: SDR family oxidoreductase [Flavobacteriales bacterium]|jgi:3-oxoacyl-[acyl-carrier protein] reductase|nr:SDR family oxidoreductase [Flavobacteriales bacterium]